MICFASWRIKDDGAIPWKNGSNGRIKGQATAVENDTDEDSQTDREDIGEIPGKRRRKQDVHRTDREVLSISNPVPCYCAFVLIKSICFKINPKQCWWWLFYNFKFQVYAHFIIHRYNIHWTLDQISYKAHISDILECDKNLALASVIIVHWDTKYLFNMMKTHSIQSNGVTMGWAFKS